MEKSSKLRIAFIIFSFILVVTSLTFAIILAVNGDTVCVPLFVIFTVVTVFETVYSIIYRKEYWFRYDLELAFEFMVIAVVFVAALPLTFILWIIECAVDALSRRNANKAMKR